MIKKQRLNIISIIFSFLLIITISFWDKLWSELWLISLFIGLPILIGFIIVFIISVYYVLKDRKNKKYLIPFIINLITIMIIVFLPLNWMRTYISFEMNLNKFEKIVQMVEVNELKPNAKKNNSLVNLPREYRHLSVGGGQIIVMNIDDQKVIFFYTFRGIPDGRSGIVYVPENVNFEELHGEIYFELHKKRELKENWYYIKAD